MVPTKCSKRQKTTEVLRSWKQRISPSITAFGSYTSQLVPLADMSGQIIATSHDLTPNGGLVGGIPLFQGNLEGAEKEQRRTREGAEKEREKVRSFWFFHIAVARFGALLPLCVRCSRLPGLKERSKAEHRKGKEQSRAQGIGPRPHVQCLFLN